MKLRQTERTNAKIKLALQGSSGSGKTYSSLLLANGLAMGKMEKVAIIDTENGSADLYSHLGKYNVVSMSPPYSPESYIEAIEICEAANMEVIVIDSLSHCWDFLLDVHSNMPGNSFTNWGKITPRQNAFVSRILQSKSHVIATMRVKQDYVLSQKNGKTVPEKVGLKAIQRNDVDYEFTIVFDIDMSHNAKASKDRTGLFIDKPEQVINPATGKKILAWCEEGAALKIDKVKQEILTCETLEGLRHLYKKYAVLGTEIYDLVIERKKQLENTASQIATKEEIVKPSKAKENGIDH